jgi:hypothetical protein
MVTRALVYRFPHVPELVERGVRSLPDILLKLAKVLI